MAVPAVDTGGQVSAQCEAKHAKEAMSTSITREQVKSMVQDMVLCCMVNELTQVIDLEQGEIGLSTVTARHLFRCAESMGCELNTATKAVAVYARKVACLAVGDLLDSEIDTAVNTLTLWS